jgi:photosystem II stability/assembly factor-like uncharacterized protein
MHENGLFRDLAFRCVGPVVMSGRVVDIEPIPGQPYSFYVAYATGGLWKTENNGMRFKPLFEEQDAVAIGDIAIDPRDPNIILVGTGEANSARSHYSGTGLYRTDDGGETWQRLGLEDSHHIGRILIHPKNPDTIYVAAMGHLYSDNEQRGVFRSKDGGKSWEKILYVDAKTGAIDITFDPSRSKVLYAAMWEKVRKAWNIDESGPGSGIYRSNDGGDTWKRLKRFPQGKHIGRIGLAVAPSNRRVVYALLDNQAPKPKEDQIGDAAISAKKLPDMTKEDVLDLPDDELGRFLRGSRFHSDYDAKKIRSMLEKDEIKVQDLVDYIVRLRAEALTQTVRGAEVYRSEDAGKTWRKMNLTYLDRMYNIAGYYFGQIRVSPDDENRIYIMGVPLLTSADGGRTFESIGGKGVHVDHHAMWIDPAHPQHIINGNDGGLNLTYDGGETWQKLNYVPVGQFYAVNVDMAKPYNIYGGLQDNGTYKGSSRSIPNETSPWETISGGDGFYIQIASDFTVYAGSQFGYYSRIDTDGRRTRVHPDSPKMDEPGLRFNWQTPILLSPHSSNVLYFGANRVFRSLDRGENLKPISPVLTNPDVTGNVPYGTITTIAESRQTFGILYAGTDDGRIHMTPDGGFTWKEIGNYLPPQLWCSRIETSKFKDGRVYMSLTGYRNDDFRTYLYKSEDFGTTWESIKANLPAESVNVIREDPVNEDILYAGTDMGVYVSLDRGQSWEVLQNGIPISPAHDLVIHPRDSDLVVGTHGRSIYVMDIEPIQKLTSKVRSKNLHLFELDNVREYKTWGGDPSAVIRKTDIDPLKITYWMSERGDVEVVIEDSNDLVVRRLKDKGHRGINVLEWDLLVDRDVELDRQLKKTQKKIEDIDKKISKLNKDAKEEDGEAEVADSNEPEASPDSDKTGEKEADAPKEGEKEREKRLKLQMDLRNAKLELDRVKEVIDEPKTYADLPRETREKMIRKIYVSAGKYNVEIKSGENSHSATLQVQSGGSGWRGRSRAEEEMQDEEKHL